MKAINEADAIFFGSSTKYADMIGNMEDILEESSYFKSRR